MSTSKTSPRFLLGAEHNKAILELRRNGLTYQAIGDRLKMSPQRAHQVVTQEIERLNREQAELTPILVRLEEARLDRLWETAFRKVRSKKTEDKTKMQAITACLKIQERRARLRGLDAVSKDGLADQILGRMTDSDLVAEADRAGIPVSPELRARLLEVRGPDEADETSQGHPETGEQEPGPEGGQSETPEGVPGAGDSGRGDEDQDHPASPPDPDSGPEPGQ